VFGASARPGGGKPRPYIMVLKERGHPRVGVAVCRVYLSTLPLISAKKTSLKPFLPSGQSANVRFPADALAM